MKKSVEDVAAARFESCKRSSILDEKRPIKMDVFWSRKNRSAMFYPITVTSHIKYFAVMN